MDGKPLITLEESTVAPANKRFRSLIQELFSLVEELYEENDRLSGEVSTQEDLTTQVTAAQAEITRLRQALVWLGSTELDAKTMSKLKTDIRKFVAETLKSSKSQEDLPEASEYTEGE
jgi:hypothetical protein